MDLAAGRQWTYRAPEGYEASRIVIGAIVTFCSQSPRIVCCSVTGTPRKRPDGSIEIIEIPFIPMTEPAFAATVIAEDGPADPPESFGQKLQQWGDDPRGLTAFTVPFEGYLDRMIAMQMAEIAGQSAA